MSAATVIRVGVDFIPLTRVRSLTEADAGADGGSGGSSPLRGMLTLAEIRLSRFATEWDLHGVAGRLAAKEAVFKLFHIADRPLPWRSVEVLKSPGKWPYVRLAEPASSWAADAGIEVIDISISHEEQFAVAVAAGATDARRTRRRSMPSTTSSNVDAVRNWLLTKHPERTSIAADEDLITARLVDSLSFIEFVLTIEEASGAEVDRENINLDDFRTLEAIERKFF